MDKDKTTMRRDIVFNDNQFWACNTCNCASIARQYGEFNFCPYCGFEIDWSNSSPHPLSIAESPKKKKRWWRR